MASATPLTYADLSPGTTVANIHTQETGAITAAAYGLVEITLYADDTALTVTPNEAQANWRTCEVCSDCLRDLDDHCETCEECGCVGGCHDEGNDSCEC